jgi:hypothetical protein
LLLLLVVAAAAAAANNNVADTVDAADNHDTSTVTAFTAAVYFSVS